MGHVNGNHYTAVLLNDDVAAKDIRWPMFGMALTKYGEKCYEALIKLQADLQQPLSTESK